MRPLKHKLHETVDLRSTLTSVATLVEVQQLLPESAVGVRQLEGPEEVVRLLEGWADSVDLVDEVLYADDALGSQGTLDHGVVGDRDALLVNLKR